MGGGEGEEEGGEAERGGGAEGDRQIGGQSRHDSMATAGIRAMPKIEYDMMRMTHLPPWARLVTALDLPPSRFQSKRLQKRAEARKNTSSDYYVERKGGEGKGYKPQEGEVQRHTCEPKACQNDSSAPLSRPCPICKVQITNKCTLEKHQRQNKRCKEIAATNEAAMRASL